MIDLKSTSEYIAWVICFFLGVQITPVWIDEIVTGIIGVVFLVIGGVIMFFVRKYLEARFRDVFKLKKKG